MKSKTSTYITATMILAALVIPVRLPAQEQQETENERTRYTVINLGTFGGTSGSSANGVNNNGLVTGIEGLPNGDQHAFLWVNGRACGEGCPSASPVISRSRIFRMKTRIEVAANYAAARVLASCMGSPPVPSARTRTSIGPAQTDSPVRSSAEVTGRRS